MFSQLTLSRRSVRGLASAGAAALALSVVPAADAAITSISPTTLSSGGSLLLSATGPTGANAYAVTTCDVSVAADTGKRCTHFTSSTAPTQLRYTPIKPGTSFSSLRLYVDRTFANYDYTIQAPGTGSTTCKNAAGSGTQCGVVVSWYSATFNASGQVTSATPVGAPDVANIRVN